MEKSELMLAAERDQFYREELLRNFDAIQAKNVGEKTSQRYSSAFFLKMQEWLDEIGKNADMFSKSIFVGLDTSKFTENQRNAILLHLETMGAKTGLYRQVMLPVRRKGRIAMEMEYDEEDERKKEQFWENLLKLIWFYSRLYHSTAHMLQDIEEEIQRRLSLINAEIDRREANLIGRIFGDASQSEKQIEKLMKKRTLLKEQKEKLNRQKRRMLTEDDLPNEEELDDIREEAAEIREAVQNVSPQVNAAKPSEKKKKKTTRLRALFRRKRPANNDSPYQTTHIVSSSEGNSEGRSESDIPPPPPMPTGE